MAYGEPNGLVTKNSLLHVYTSPNHGSSVLRHWPVTHVTHSHLLTRWPNVCCYGV